MVITARIASLEAVHFKQIADEIDPDAFDQHDKEAFQDLIHRAKYSWQIPAVAFMDRFAITEGTLSRWAHGKSAPHPMARPLIVAWIRDQLLERARRERVHAHGEEIAVAV